MKNKGEYFEEIVELLERSIDPSARVEHDVQLPILNSRNGATRQCDIVIRTGIKPRETITIIEVQNRTKKPSPNDIGGWIDKLNEVGAQHLICVSKKGFSKNVKDRASLSNGKIRLVQLSEVPKEKIPLDFLKMHACYQEFNLKKVLSGVFSLSSIDLDVYGIDEEKIDLKAIKFNSPVFSYDKENKLTLIDLCSKVIPQINKLEKGIKKLIIKGSKNPLYFYYQNVFIGLELELEFEWFVTFTEIPIELLSYDQDEDGTLAWLAKGILNTSNGELSFEVPVTKFENGYTVLNFRVNKPDKLGFSVYGFIED